MKRFLMLMIMCLFSTSSSSAQQDKDPVMNQKVLIKTNKGDIELELYTQKAPKTVENFLTYVDEKHYDNTIFHRVIDGFMIQGGGYSTDFIEKKTHAPIQNEADNKLSNERGTIAMARTSDIHSASAQFFINVSDNTFLDFQSPTSTGYGYCVFGKVTKGMDVVEQIKCVQTGPKNGHQDVPVENVVIKEVTKL